MTKLNKKMRQGINYARGSLNSKRAGLGLGSIGLRRFTRAFLDGRSDLKLFRSSELKTNPYAVPYQQPKVQATFGSGSGVDMIHEVSGSGVVTSRPKSPVVHKASKPIANPVRSRSGVDDVTRSGSSDYSDGEVR